MDSQIFRLGKSKLERLGTSSLQGHFLNEKFDINLPVKIVFDGSSLEYCRNHNGPEVLLLSDYVPYVLVESIIVMIQRGWSLSVELDGDPT